MTNTQQTEPASTERGLPVVAYMVTMKMQDGRRITFAVDSLNAAKDYCDFGEPDPLTTIASATEAIEQAKLRPAPCARHCEAQAFTIEIRQKDKSIAELEADAKRMAIWHVDDSTELKDRIAELEESVASQLRTIKALTAGIDMPTTDIATYLGRQDNRIAELEALVKQARDALSLISLGHHDPMPTRKLSLTHDAIEIDSWWQSYYQSNDQMHKRIAKSALNAINALGVE